MLEKHKISISQWLDSVIKSAKKGKFRMLPQFSDYDSLKLDEDDLKILADKLGGGCLEFAQRCMRAMKDDCRLETSFSIYGVPLKASHYGAWDSHHKMLIDSSAGELVVLAPETTVVSKNGVEYRLSGEDLSQSRKTKDGAMKTEPWTRQESLAVAIRASTTKMMEATGSLVIFTRAVRYDGLGIFVGRIFWNFATCALTWITGVDGEDKEYCIKFSESHSAEDNVLARNYFNNVLKHMDPHGVFISSGMARLHFKIWTAMEQRGLCGKND